MSETTSLELSKALKEAGAKQESEHSWRVYITETMHCETLHYSEHVKGLTGDKYSAFDCHELLERLPDGAWVRKFGGPEHLSFRYDVAINGVIGGCSFMQGNTPAEALGKLYLWCLQNGRCPRSKEWAERKGAKLDPMGLEACGG